MGTLIGSGIGVPSLRRIPTPRRTAISYRKRMTVLPLCCLRSNGDDDRQDEQRFEGTNNVDKMQYQGAKQHDIWKLFKEAQQNILYLNKQRLAAIEELNKTNTEKRSLLSRIEKLEAEKNAGAGKDNLSICWELLLQIDSMVLTNMISPGEASELRRLVIKHKLSVADIFTDIPGKRDSELLEEIRELSDISKKNAFHIVHICTEMAPLVSKGSIASYVTGISCALQRKGHLVEVILPKYACLNLDEVQGLHEVKAEAYSYYNGQLHGNRVWTGVVYGIGVTLIEPLQYSSLFSREMIYGYPDDFERFSYFSRASLDYIVKCGKKPDVLHVHNWETAIVGPLFWDLIVKQGLEGTRILLTCQDLSMQCLEQPDKLALCGLDPARLHRSDRLQDNSSTHLVNILKGGIVYSNGVIIMSSIHSKHRFLHSSSHGLESTLGVHRDKLVIAPYGLDKLQWDPSTDCFLPENFNAQNMEGKAVCKVEVQQRLGLSKDASNILVGCIFSERGDIDLNKLKDVVWKTMECNVQIVFIGNSERFISNQSLESLQKELKDDHLKFVLTYDEALLHLTFAGSDIILCHSLDPVEGVPTVVYFWGNLKFLQEDYVPCRRETCLWLQSLSGLWLKALRYGTAPIVVDHDAAANRHFINRDHETTKYSQFINSTYGNISLDLAIDEIRNSPSKWERRIKEAMRQDFSWDGECCDIHVSAYTAIKNL